MNKGQMGYLAQYKKRRILIVAVLILGIIAFVGVGYWQTKSVKNLLTVMGILLSLPLANMLSGLLLVWNMKPLEESKCNEMMEQLTHVGSDQFLWNLALSSTDKVRNFPVVVCSDTRVMAYFKGKEDKAELEAAKKFFSNLLKNNCHRVDFQLFTSEETFLKAAKETDFAVASEQEWERVMETILVYEM